jgi:hypothetical protein
MATYQDSITKPSGRKVRPEAGFLEHLLKLREVAGLIMAQDHLHEHIVGRRDGRSGSMGGRCRSICSGDANKAKDEEGEQG